MKKTILTSLLLAALCTCYFVGCAVKESSPDNSPSTDTQPTPVIDSITTSYDNVLSLQTEGYRNLSLKDFHATVNEAINSDEDFLSDFSALMEETTPEDNAYSFVYETLDNSINEVASSQMGNPIALSRYLKAFGDEYTTETNETFYNFVFTSLYSMEYHVIDEAALTVGERDELLAAYQAEFQNAVSGMEREQLTADNIKVELQKIANDLCTELSTNVLVFENAEIQSVEIHDGDQEYQG
jgi:hypothetical protein